MKANCTIAKITTAKGFIEQAPNVTMPRLFAKRQTDKRQQVQRLLVIFSSAITSRHPNLLVKAAAYYSSIPQSFLGKLSFVRLSFWPVVAASMLLIHELA
jgi:hypothetical protein